MTRLEAILELDKGFSTKMADELFCYLDDLRESGVTNMFGATAYLVYNFDLDLDFAKKVLSYWMKSFSK